MFQVVVWWFSPQNKLRHLLDNLGRELQKSFEGLTLRGFGLLVLEFDIQTIHDDCSIIGKGKFRVNLIPIGSIESESIGIFIDNDINQNSFLISISSIK